MLLFLLQSLSECSINIFYVNSMALSWPSINQCQIIYYPLLQSNAYSQRLVHVLKKWVLCYHINWYLALRCAFFCLKWNTVPFAVQKDDDLFLRSFPITLECKTCYQLMYKAAGTEQKRHKRLTRIQTITKWNENNLLSEASQKYSFFWALKTSIKLHNGLEQNHRA